MVRVSKNSYTILAIYGAKYSNAAINFLVLLAIKFFGSAEQYIFFSIAMTVFQSAHYLLLGYQNYIIKLWPDNVSNKDRFVLLMIFMLAPIGFSCFVGMSFPSLFNKYELYVIGILIMATTLGFAMLDGAEKHLSSAVQRSLYSGMFYCSLGLVVLTEVTGITSVIATISIFFIWLNRFNLTSIFNKYERVDRPLEAKALYFGLLSITVPFFSLLFKSIDSEVILLAERADALFFFDLGLKVTILYAPIYNLVQRRIYRAVTFDQSRKFTLWVSSSGVGLCLVGGGSLAVGLGQASVLFLGIIVAIFSLAQIVTLQQGGRGLTVYLVTSAAMMLMLHFEFVGAVFWLCCAYFMFSVVGAFKYS